MFFCFGAASLGGSGLSLESFVFRCKFEGYFIFTCRAIPKPSHISVVTPDNVIL